jgi:heme/copper-type cytochrome/quinol oxidase subunit 3
MSEATTPPPASGLSRESEEEGFYHEAALNAAWTGSRLAVGGLCFLFGSFVFAYFYLRSLDSDGRWQGSGFVHPSLWMGTTIMLLALLSAGTHYFVLQRIKAGHKLTWQVGGLIALGFGLAAVALQVYQLANLPFPPGSSGYSSVFAGFYPVFLVVQLAALLWLEMLLAKSRYIPALSFVEQPPTYTETYLVQRFQASLSAFSTLWSFLAVVTVLFWILFYVMP